MKQFSEAFGRKLEGSGITRIQWIALYYINEHDGISQRELSQLMYVKDSSAGRLIDRLERESLVERIRSDKDRRVITLKLSSRGNEIFSKLLPYGQAFNDQLTKGIKNEELEIFEKVLQQMLENVKE